MLFEAKAGHDFRDPERERGIGIISADWSENSHADMAMAMAVISCSPIMRTVVRCNNAASMNGGAGGQASGGVQSVGVLVAEPPLQSSPMHSVTVVDRQRGITHQFSVPEDQYILHTGEDQNISLPFSCRHGCCTACAVRVKSGQLHQPEALGISAELKAQGIMPAVSILCRALHRDTSNIVVGYGLLCVGYALSDLEVETQDEDEVYWLQFGQFFARGPIENDNYALELAMADE